MTLYIQITWKGGHNEGRKRWKEEWRDERKNEWWKKEWRDERKNEEMKGRMKRWKEEWRDKRKKLKMKGEGLNESLRYILMVYTGIYEGGVCG